MKPLPLHTHLITLLFALTLFICTNPLCAQKTISPILNPTNQLRVAGTAVQFDKLHLQNTGESLLTSKPELGVEGTITYSRHVISGFRANVGVSLRSVPFNYSYHFEAPNGEFYTTRGFSFNQWLYAIPITIQKTFAFRPDRKWLFSLESGIKVNYTENGIGIYEELSHSSINQVLQEFFELRYEKPSQKRYLSYIFKTGIMRHGAKGNTIHCNFVYHYSQENIGTGTYAFHNLGYDSFGTIEHRAGSVGLEFGYGLGIGRSPGSR